MSEKNSMHPGPVAAMNTEERGSQPVSTVIEPGATIGILGGGQLGRMLTLAATPLGYRCVTLDPTPDSPCGQIARQVTAAYDDVGAARELAGSCDVVTYEFENVDAGVAALLEQESYVPQGSKLLYTTQHRLREKRAIEAAGVPVAPYREVTTAGSMQQAVGELGLPCVLKTVMGGYDGKGQRVIRHLEEVQAAYEELNTAGVGLVLESFVPFQCEISVVAARSTKGEVRTFPPAENIHVNNILHASIVPARVSEELQARAEQLAAQLIEGLDAVGLLAVEMFVTKAGEIYVNELAPRPHNSGHYTMDACATSQFEQHIRAICGLPLADPRLLTPVVMVNILGEHMEEVLKLLTSTASQTATEKVIPKLHLYGKSESKNGRKMGHVNLLCQDTEAAMQWIEQTNIWRNH